MAITNAQRDLLSVAYGIAPGIAQALQTADVALPTALTVAPDASVGFQTVLQAYPPGSLDAESIARFQYLTGEISKAAADAILADDGSFTDGHDFASSSAPGFSLAIGGVDLGG